MIDPTRREFLATAGATIASAKIAGAGDARARHVRAQLGTNPLRTRFPPHRPLTVEGIHAYTDRVSVAAGETIRFHVSSSYPYELQVCRLGTDVDSPSIATRSCIRSARRRPAVQPIHPGSYLHRREAARSPDRARRA